MTIAALNYQSLKKKNFSHLNEHKFSHNFLDNVNPMCGSEPKPTSHYQLCLEYHQISRSKLLKNACSLDQTLKNYEDDHLIHTLLYSSEKKKK